MSWFPVGEDDTSQWRLDIVALLAVAGESFVGEHTQAITASALGMLPRIMPAPQALLRPLRPASLPSVVAKLTGVYSGTTLDAVGFFANIIHPLEYLPPFSFQVIEILHRDEREWDLAVERRRSVDETRGENNTQTAKSSAITTGADLEAGGTLPRPGLRRKPTVKEQVSNAISNAPIKRDQPIGRTSLFSPLNLISLISFLMSLGLIIAAAVWHDAVAIIAISLISIAASVICYASWWRPIILARRGSSIPLGDMMIRTREGAFLLIKCSENVARELYSGAQECEYFVSGRKYRFLMTLGTVLIIPSVILMGNCSFRMQVLIGVAYTLQNILYWIMGSLPLRTFWDLRNYIWRDVTPADSRNAHHFSFDDDGTETKENMPSFTRTLWYAIRETKVTGWAGRSGAMPGTQQWKQWLDEAEEAAKRGDRQWPAVSRKDDIMSSAYLCAREKEEQEKVKEEKEKEKKKEKEKEKTKEEVTPRTVRDIGTQTIISDDWDLD